MPGGSRVISRGASSPSSPACSWWYGASSASVSTAPVGRVLHLAGGQPVLTALLSTGVSAVGTNLINNVPMALVLVSAIGAPHGAAGRALVYGALLGCDLGPNLTTTGSLSTMLWVLLLRQRGLEVSSLQYLRYGVVVTPLMLLVAAVILGVTV